MPKRNNTFLVTQTVSSVILVLTVVFLFVGRIEPLNLMVNMTIQDTDCSDKFSMTGGVIKYDYDAPDDWSYENDDLAVNPRMNAVTAKLPALKYGVYKLRVKYNAKYDTTIARSIPLTLSLSGGDEKAYSAYNILTFNYLSDEERLVWVTDFSGTKDDIVVGINAKGYGQVVIDDIEFSEYTPWKIGVLLLELIVFLFIFLQQKYHLIKFNKENCKDILISIVLIALASAPLFTGEMRTYGGHDYAFHIDRISSIAEEIKHGHFPVLYQTTATTGTGYISNIMYPKLFTYIPAVLHLFGLPLSVAYNIFVIFINTLTLIICKVSFMGIFKDKRYAWLGTGLYLIGVYRISNIYIRSAVGEYLAMTFLPLIIYSFYHIYFEVKKASFRDGLPLIVAATGLVQTHVLTVEMVIPFIVIFALIHFRQTIANIGMLFAACGVTVLLNLFYLIPFLDVYGEELHIRFDVAEDIQNQGISLFTSLYKASVFASTNQLAPRTIGMALVVGMLICIFSLVINWKKDKGNGKKLRLEMLIYGLICLMLCSNRFPWSTLAGKDSQFALLFTSIQFPWRYLGLTTAFFCFSTVGAVKSIVDNAKNQKFCIRVAIYGLLTATVVTLGGFYIQNLTNSVEHAFFKNLDTAGIYDQDNLYLPKNADFDMLWSNGITVLGDACVEDLGTGDEYFRTFRIDNKNTMAKITFPVLYYDFLPVKDIATGYLFEKTMSEQGYITVAFESGYQGIVQVKYHISWIWMAGNVISLVTLLVLLYNMFLKSLLKSTLLKNDVVC